MTATAAGSSGCRQYHGLSSIDWEAEPWVCCDLAARSCSEHGDNQGKVRSARVGATVAVALVAERGRKGSGARAARWRGESNNGEKEESEGGSTIHQKLVVYQCTKQIFTARLHSATMVRKALFIARCIKNRS